MKYATDQSFRMALEAHIKMGASDAVGVSRLRKRIVFERLLARLVARAPGEWVLKGGFALELRLGNVARSTKDADFEWLLPEEAAIELLLDAAALDLGDHFTFALERADETPDLPGAGQRWRVTVTLAGRIFERAVIDVAFSAAPVHQPDEVTTPEPTPTNEARAGGNGRAARAMPAPARRIGNASVPSPPRRVSATPRSSTYSSSRPAGNR